MPSTIDINVPALQERVTKLLKDPAATWPVIAAEPTTTEQLYKNYIGPLAAIPAVASFIGTVRRIEWSVRSSDAYVLERV